MLPESAAHAHYRDLLNTTHILETPVIVFTRDQLEALPTPVSAEDTQELGDDYAKAMRQNMQIQHIRDRINELGVNAHGTPWANTDPRIVRSIYAMLHKTLHQQRSLSQISGILLRDDYSIHFAHEAEPETYPEPAGCLIPMSVREYRPAQWFGALTGIAPEILENANLPGKSVHWEYMLLNHEINQCPGVDEAPSDRVAAGQYIRQFGDLSLPLAWADMRAVNAVLKAQDGTYSSSYGWAPVEEIDAEIDYARRFGRPASQTSDLKDIRFDAPDPKSDEVRDFADQLRKKAPEAYAQARLETLLNAAKHFTPQNVFANRFVKALERLTGQRSYNEYSMKMVPCRHQDASLQ